MGEDSMKCETKIYPLEMNYLPEKFQKKAKAELNDTPDNREKGLKLLRELMANDGKLHELSFDEDFLLQYLISTKFKVRKAFSKLKAIVNLRRKYSEAFTNFNFESIAISTRNKIVSLLPYRCHEGCAIILVQLDNWFPEEFPVEEVKRLIVILLLQSLRYPMTQVNGFKAIFDVKSNPIRLLRHVTPSNLYLMYHGPEECSPGRFKSIHIVNESKTLNVAWYIMKYFISEKIKKRVRFHASPNELLKVFPAQVLPTQYGGELKDFDMTDWLRDAMEPQNLPTIVRTASF